MNYQKIHDQIIERAISEKRTRNRDRSKQEIYYELHHIKPKCIGGSNDKSNLVLLTGREHFVIHKLLVKIYPDSKGLIYAFNRMCKPNTSKVDRQFIITSKDYEYARKLFSEVHSSNVEMYKIIASKNKGKVAPNLKKIVQINPITFKIINIFISAKEAGIQTGATTCHRSANSNLSRKSSGFYWIYLENISEDEIKKGFIIKNKYFIKRERKLEKCRYCDIITRGCIISQYHNEKCKFKS